MSSSKGKEEEEEYVVPATLDVAPTKYAEEVWGKSTPEQNVAFATPSSVRHLLNDRKLLEESTAALNEKLDVDDVAVPHVKTRNKAKTDPFGLVTFDEDEPPVQTRKKVKTAAAEEQSALEKYYPLIFAFVVGLAGALLLRLLF